MKHRVAPLQGKSVKFLERLDCQIDTFVDMPTFVMHRKVVDKLLPPSCACASQSKIMFKPAGMVFN